MQYLLLFLEGIITFISPCLLPILPVYVSYFAAGQPNKRRALGNALGFVLGFTMVFVALGAFAGTLGRWLHAYATIVNILTGLVVVLLGLHFMGVINIGFVDKGVLGNVFQNTCQNTCFMRIGSHKDGLKKGLPNGLKNNLENSPENSPENDSKDISSNHSSNFSSSFSSNLSEPTSVPVKDLRFFSSVLFGLVFSVGWTPCVSVFLGSALMMASQQGRLTTGIIMLLVYSLGLGIPFVISALLLDSLKEAFGFIKRHYRIITIASGVLLVVVGLMMALGYWGRWLSLLAF